MKKKGYYPLLASLCLAFFLSGALGNKKLVSKGEQGTACNREPKNQSYLNHKDREKITRQFGRVGGRPSGAPHARRRGFSAPGDREQGTRVYTTA